MQDGRKAVWSIPYVSGAFFPSFKHNFIAYYSSKVSLRPDFNFELHQLWQSGFSRVYSNFCCSCSFEPEIIKIGQSSNKMYRNNIVNFQESTNFKCVYKRKSGNILKAPRTNGSNKERALFLANKPRIFPWRTERMLQRIQKHRELL